MHNDEGVIRGLPDDELAMQVVRRLRKSFLNKMRLPDDDAKWLARQFAQIRADERDQLCAAARTGDRRPRSVT